ncbi:MAG: methylated-DNA--[protein]-cysteine S-methyltransferase [Desulfocapsa sp.]|nr:methylated-DNA--[protein]-cysteine S-methyltransferase [Desulfocapsa sp.]MBN4048667.1 methylated-DNA--[protein]-cysteine S-methyltransferase [bacterium AH-315-N22]
MTIYYQKMTSPIGSIFIAADKVYLRAITFDRNEEKIRATLSRFRHERNPIITQTHAQLQEYFSGIRTEFDLPIAFTGTPFQNQTWRALLTIPYGETRSYSEQALVIGNPKAVRAVGRTNGLNPIGIVVPCHRVIGKSGKLTGYAGGLDKKVFLLNLENEVLNKLNTINGYYDNPGSM